MDGRLLAGLFLLGLVGASRFRSSGSGGVVRSSRAGGPKKRDILYHLEFFDRSVNSDKFWEIWDLGNGKAEVRWGRNGSKGQSQIVAMAEALNRRAEKIRKGYEERSPF